jgi:uncharacterized protein YuzB (UPF0349 family)
MALMSYMKRLAVTLEETNSQPKTYAIKVEQITYCGICEKSLVRGDYVYGACHECARKVIHQASKSKSTNF